MASIAFDTLDYAQQLKEAGVPDRQAEVQAKLMGQAFGFYVDDLGTKDYLDKCLDARFARQEVKLEQRFLRLEGQIRLLMALQALTAAAILVPAIARLFAP